MKIGITTIFRGNTNYGGMLQAFALVQAIKNLGFHNVEQINFEYNRNPIYPSLLSRCSQYSIRQIIAKMMELSVERKYSLIEDKLNKRLSLFEQFLDTQIPKSKLYKANNHAQIGKDYDVLITGSDQVWNPNVVRDVFVFDFPTEAKKIAYAASIARNALSKKEKAYMLPRIAKFDHIGMREKTGKNILAREGISSSVVLDPTMLLDSKQWNRVTSPRLINGKYVLIYSFSDCKQKNNILDFYKKQGIQTVLIPYAKMKYNSYDGGVTLTLAGMLGLQNFYR